MIRDISYSPIVDIKRELIFNCYIRAGFLFEALCVFMEENMEKLIKKYIEEESKKLMIKHQLYHNSQELEYKRNCRRITNPLPKDIKIPQYWSEDKKYNPFYTYKHSKQIAKSITNKIINGTYKPHKPYIMEIQKKNGKGTRMLSVYQIPDAAVSNYLYKRLLSKNKHRFSPLAYAYRNDRNAHYAVQDISLELQRYPRVFIAEFDFTDFFGSISHKYLLKQLDENGFFVSEFEKELINRFIMTRDKGVPQGTSISLFLANLVCWNLDRQLEKAGLRFARYADDTIIWSNDYSKICKALEIINNFSDDAGISINVNKSDGISLLTGNSITSELVKTKSSFNFLGYKLSIQTVAIKENSINKIKKQISYLLYRNLIQPIKGDFLKAVVIPNAWNNDPAFVTAIMQIRRYLYGNLNEEKLSNYINGSYKRLSFKGVMSYYPLITDEEQLKSLDSWLLITIYNCLKLRLKLFVKHNRYVENYFPFNVKKENFLQDCKKRDINGKVGLIQIPSFMRIYKAIKKGVVEFGIAKTMNPNSNTYNYFE